MTRIAAWGHTASQCPQEIDSPPVTEAIPSTSEMVPVGQTVMHNPQPLQSSLFISILFSSITVSSIYISVLYDNTAEKSFLIFFFSYAEVQELLKQHDSALSCLATYDLQKYFVSFFKRSFIISIETYVE
jgi:hypothetical protein